MPAAASRSAASMRSCACASKLRTVPVTVASAGSTLWLLPPFTRVTDSTADSAGSMRRETMVLSCATSWLAASSTSGVRCGCAAWPPRPRSTMSKRSAAAMIGPGRVCAWPSGRSGQLCSAYTASHGKRSNRPSSTITRAPPRPSSAGWKMKCTVPSKRRVRASWRAAPSSIAVWPSWPQPWCTPAMPARHARGATARRSATRPCRRAGRPRGALLPWRKRADTPVPASPSCTSRPSRRNAAATMPAVRRSSNASSGCACRSRRSATRSGQSGRRSCRRAHHRTPSTARPTRVLLRHVDHALESDGQLRRSARCMVPLLRRQFDSLVRDRGTVRQIPRPIDGREFRSRHDTSGRAMNPSSSRQESDFLGARSIPAAAYYGVHTLRAVENFPITGTPISCYAGPGARAGLRQGGGGAAPTPSSALLDRRARDAIVARLRRDRAAARCTSSSSST